MEILNWLDDHSRYCSPAPPTSRVTGDDVVITFLATTDSHGVPASTLTDIQAGWRGIGLSRRPAGEDRGRPAPARHRCLTEWSARDSWPVDRVGGRGHCRRLEMPC